MINLIRADFYRMCRSGAMRLLFALAVLGAAGMLLYSRQVAAGRIAASMAGLGVLFSDVSLAGILGAVAAGIFICGDLDNKVIHDAIAGGISRFSVVAGKTVSFLAAVVLFLLPYAAAAGVGLGTGKTFNLAQSNIGYMTLLADWGGRHLAAGRPAQLFGLMLFLLLVYAAELSLCVPLAVALKKPVLVVAVYYAVSLLSGQLIPMAQSNKTLQAVVDCTPFSGQYLLPSPDMGAGHVAGGIAACVGFIALMAAAAYALFRRAEIK